MYINELKAYFTSVIDWVGGVFTETPAKELRGLEWGRLHEEYHATAYNPTALAADLALLRGDPAVEKTKTQLLEGRLFDDKTKQARTACRAARPAQAWRTRTRPASTSWTRWKPTMCPHGHAAVSLTSTTARCSASRTTAPKATSSVPDQRHVRPINLVQNTAQRALFCTGCSILHDR